MEVVNICGVARQRGGGRWRVLCSFRVMRLLLVVVVSAAVVGGVVAHRKSGQSDAAKPNALPASQQGAAPREHHWPKRALDRAADVKRQVTETRREDDAR